MRSKTGCAVVPCPPLEWVPGQRSAPLTEAFQFHLNKAFDVRGAGIFQQYALLFQITQELASSRYIVGHRNAAIAQLFQVLAKIDEHRRGPRTRRPFTLHKT